MELLLVSPEGKCYGIFFVQWIFSFLLPPYAIPPDATYLGKAVVNGDSCTVWNYWWGYHRLNIFVREKDGVAVKGQHFENSFGNLNNWELTNIKLSVDPSLYDRPASCVETDTWNPSWQSHLPWEWCLPICMFLEPMREAVLSLM